MSQKNETPALILALFVTAAILGGGYWFFKDKLFSSNNNTSQTSQQSRISLGERLLVKADATTQKQAGIEAFAKGDYQTAISQFQASLKVNPNDPETLIYLNNAQIAPENPLKIAVAVPIGGNLDVALEMLRGVAQAQNEINQKGGINGRGLQVEIANDDNDPTLSQQVATKLVQDSNIIAVVGHNSSDATLAAAPEYQQGGLVMISPTSNAKEISELGEYIFRTIPSVRFQADNLSRYTVNVANKKNVAICFDSQAKYTQSLQEEFISAIFADGGKVVEIKCDLASTDFNPSGAVSEAVSGGANVLLLIPSVDRLSTAIEVAKANQQRLFLLGSSTLYTFKTLEEGQTSVRNMILSVPWHPDAFFNNPFPQQARKLWGGDVNWRSALAYDATKAIVTGLESGEISRQGLQKALSSESFVSQGATGEIRFLPSGDRNGADILVKIVPGQKSGTGLDFVPLR